MDERFFSLSLAYSYLHFVKSWFQWRHSTVIVGLNYVDSFSNCRVENYKIVFSFVREKVRKKFSFLFQFLLSFHRFSLYLSFECLRTCFFLHLRWCYYCHSDTPDQSANLFTTFEKFRYLMIVYCAVVIAVYNLVTSMCAMCACKKRSYFSSSFNKWIQIVIEIEHQVLIQLLSGLNKWDPRSTNEITRIWPFCSLAVSISN